MNSIRRHVMNNHRDATIICSAGGPKHLKIDADQWLPGLMFQCGSACATGPGRHGRSLPSVSMSA
jgi:hypothetical protein